MSGTTNAPALPIPTKEYDDSAEQRFRNILRLYFNVLDSRKIAGSDTQVQFNDRNAFGASSNFTYDKTTNTLTVGNLSAAVPATSITGTLPVNHGGTSLATTPTNGQLLIGNTSTSKYALSTLTAGANIGVTNGAGTISVAATPSGSTTQVQYNNASAFGASSLFTYNSGTNTVSFGNITGSALGMTIQPKAPTVTETAGDIVYIARNAAKANSNGGGFSYTSGNALGNGIAGNFNIYLGSGVLGGSFTVVCGDSNSTGISGGSGGITLISGNLGTLTGGAFGMSGADFTINQGGSFVMNAGYGGPSGNGGDFSLQLGGGGLSEGNMFFQDSGGRNLMAFKLAGGSGSALQIGFYNTTAKSQPAAYTLTYSTASRTVPAATFTNLATTAATNIAPYGFSTQAQADAIATKVNALGADVLVLKQLLVSLIKDLSATYGVGLNAT